MPRYIKLPNVSDSSWILAIGPDDVDDLVKTPSAFVSNITRSLRPGEPAKACEIAPICVHPEIVLHCRYDIPDDPVVAPNEYFVASADGSSSFLLEACFGAAARYDFKVLLQAKATEVHAHSFVQLLSEGHGAHCHFEIIPRNHDGDGSLIDDLVIAAINNPQSLVAALNDTTLVDRHAERLDDGDITKGSTELALAGGKSLAVTVSLIPLENEPGRAMERWSCQSATWPPPPPPPPTCVPGSTCSQMVGAWLPLATGFKVFLASYTLVIWRNVNYNTA